MEPPRNQEQRYDQVIILFLLALFVLLSPLVEWWAADDSPWYTPYALWLGLICLVFILARRRGRHDV